MKSPTHNDATISGMREKSQMHLERWGIIFWPVTGYILLLLALQPVIGPIPTVLLALPVAMITWELGTIWGVIAAILGGAAYSYYLLSTNTIDLNTLLVFKTIPGVMVLVTMAALISFLRNRMEEYFRINMESRSREEYFSLLNEITNRILLASDINLVLQEISKETADLVGADNSCIVQWSEEKKEAVSASGGTASIKFTRPLDTNNAVSLNLTAAAMEAGHILTIDNVENSSYLSPETAKSIPSRSIITAPLISRGHKLGAAVFEFTSLHSFTPEEVERAEHAANHIAAAILNSKQEAELTNRLHESDAFAKIALALSKTEHTGLPSVLQLILEFAKDLIHGTQQAVIHLLDDNKEFLIPTALIGYEQSTEGKKKMRIGEGIAGQATLHGEAISIGDAHTDSRFMKLGPNSKTRSLIVVPIIGAAGTLGTISIQSKIPNVFTSHDMSLLLQLGTQASIAIENARLYAEAKQEIIERKKAEDALRDSVEKELKQRLIAETTTDATLALVSFSEKEKVLNEILNQVQRLIPGSSVNITLLNKKEGAYEITWRGFKGSGYDSFSQSPLLLSISSTEQAVIETHEPHIIKETQDDPHWKKIEGTEWIRSHITIPLIWRDNQILGLFELDGSHPNMFDEETIQKLSPLINAVTVALQSAQLLERTQLALRETNALYRINQGLVALNPHELLEDVVDLFQNNLKYYHVQVFIVEEKTGDFTLRASSGDVGRQLMEQNTHIKAGSGIVGHVLETSQAFYTNDVDDVVFFQKNPLLPDTKSEMAVPVKIENKIVGVINVLQAPPNHFTDRDLQLAMAVADQLSVALQKANLYNELQTSLQHEKDVRNQLIQNERLAIMGRLLATVSHELNNPLQAIQNALFLLKSEQGISKQGMQDLEIVLAESERMANLIERLRSTYRPTHDEDFQLTEINKIISEVHQLVATHLKHRNIEFVFHPDEHLPTIPALSAQVRQVVLNLVMNAADAMNTGGTVTVKTKMLPNTDEVLVSVSDTGEGIAPDILPSIFEAFITNKQSGTGIGLTISHDIVLKHNGRIAAENNPDTGATFNVWLPAQTKEITK